MTTTMQSLVAGNRITGAIARMRENIADRIANGLTTQEAADRMDRELDMSFDEYCKFQELKSEAHASGLLSFGEAQAVYAMIGESVETFNALDVAEKVVLTKLFSELLARRIRGR